MGTVNLPAATVGVAYSDTLPVPQLTAPFTWSVSAGTLPTGVALGPTTGQLTGTPATAGNYNFTVKVTDVNNMNAATSLAMSVNSTAYPSASNTGPAAGTVLKTIGSASGQVSSGPGWVYAGGYVKISGAGTVFNGFNLSGFGVAVFANNVTISNCVISVGGQSVFPVSIQTDQNNNGKPITSFTIKNCTISGSDDDMNRAAACIKDVYGATTGILVQACNLYWTANGIQVYSGNLIGNYIHDLICNVSYGDHVNGINVSGGTNAMLIQNNTILNSNGQTDCIALFQDTAPPAIANKVINNNLMAGGGYCVYGGQSGAEYAGLPASNIVITNNAISTVYYPTGGAFGPIIYFSPGNSGNEWSGNVWHDGPNEGLAIPAP
jgi:putative Ig domain-containing protein